MSEKNEKIENAIADAIAEATDAVLEFAKDRTRPDVVGAKQNFRNRIKQVIGQISEAVDE